jgi:hypothetical protein
MNIAKYNSYKYAIDTISNATKSQDFALCIAAIALAESIIADRCQSFVHYKEPEFYSSKKRISTNNLIQICGKHNKKCKILVKNKNGITFSSEDLFNDLLKWLETRNIILHRFAKSEPLTPTIAIEEFIEITIKAAFKAEELVSCLTKWHKNSKKQISTSFNC